MATKSPLGRGGDSVPKSKLQGSPASKKHTHKPDVQKSNGGFMKPVAGMSKRMMPKHSGGKGVGGSGNGSHRGDSLPR